MMTDAEAPGHSNLSNATLRRSSNYNSNPVRDSRNEISTTAINNSSNNTGPRIRNNSISFPLSPMPLLHQSPRPRRPRSRSGSFNMRYPSSIPVNKPVMPSLADFSISNDKKHKRSLQLSPQHNPTVEAALQLERSRIKNLEDFEQNLNCPIELRHSLKQERLHSLRLTTELATVKSLSIQSQAEAEVHEECLINGLLRRLECLQREKGRIIVELEREEEMLTNTLQKKLNEVRREKALLQKQIEKEHLSNTNLKQQYLSAIAMKNERNANDAPLRSELDNDTYVDKNETDDGQTTALATVAALSSTPTAIPTTGVNSSPSGRSLAASSVSSTIRSNE